MAIKSNFSDEGVVMQKIGELSGKMDLVIGAVDRLQTDVHKRADRQDNRIDRVENEIGGESNQRQKDIFEIRQEIQSINVERANQKGKIAIITAAAISIGALGMAALSSAFDKFIGG